MKVQIKLYIFLAKPYRRDLPRIRGDIKVGIGTILKTRSNPERALERVQFEDQLRCSLSPKKSRKKHKAVFYVSIVTIRIDKNSYIRTSERILFKKET